jgi:hypothetical protein
MLPLAAIAEEAAEPHRFEFSGYYGGEKRLLYDDVAGNYDGRVFGATFSTLVGDDVWIEGTIEHGYANWTERSGAGPNGWESIHTSRMRETIGMVVLQKRWTNNRYSLFTGAGFAYGHRNYYVEEISRIYYLEDSPVVQKNKYTTPREGGGRVFQAGMLVSLTAHLFVRAQIDLHGISPGIRTGAGYRF